MTNNIIDREVNKAFGKKIYLLGEDADGVRYWLEAPSWDCGWYWGFGYIESYTNNKHPELARDIDCHQHWETSVVGENNDKDGGYCHNPSTSKLFTKTVFNEEQGWELAELFKEFYFLRDAAENFGRGKCNIANTIIKNWKDEELAKKINKELIPTVTARILDILNPLK